MPTQLNIGLVILAHYLIFFRLTGQNDYLTWNLSAGLGTAVRAPEDYHYVLVDQKKYFKTCSTGADIGKLYYYNMIVQIRIYGKKLNYYLALFQTIL